MISIIKNISKDQLLYGEWLLTNGMGGFACGSLSGAMMRKYHSLLIAALPNPYGRIVMLNFVADVLILEDKTEIPLFILNKKDQTQNETPFLIEYRLEYGIPIFRYQYKDIIIEKSLLLIYHQNTLHMNYKVISSNQKLELRWRPFFHFRAYEDPVNVEVKDESYAVHVMGDDKFEIQCPNFPPLRINTPASFTASSEILSNVYYAIEEARGYAHSTDLKSPGVFQIPLENRTTFLVSTEPWSTIFALTPKAAWLSEKMRKRTLLKIAGAAGKFPTTAKLILAADQFIIKPSTRAEDMIRLQALGQESRTVIAGYPWFTDWGRDTMISLEGLTLLTGRGREANSILLTFAQYIQGGLIPNMFPDGKDHGIYNTADATLWFFHAINKYIEATGDDDILELLLPKLQDIIGQHINGTRFGIKMDQDGLLMQGEPGVQLTWMDAKVSDWVVTPRRGKAVEINALWYNALRLYEKWSDKSSELSQKCYASFNEKFWFAEGKYLYDVINGEEKDTALRPNQLFAISLKYPVLQKDRWKLVLDAVQKELYTPFGLRTLSRSHPEYKDSYDGDLRSRDAAYHQGTIWPWLIGPYVDTWLKVYPHDFEKAHELIKGLEDHLNESCLWSIEEIFDACPPYKKRGCFAQAWSVAELLRCMIKTLPFLQKH